MTRDVIEKEFERDRLFKSVLLTNDEQLLVDGETDEEEISPPKKKSPGKSKSSKKKENPQRNSIESTLVEFQANNNNSNDDSFYLQESYGSLSLGDSTINYFPGDGGNSPKMQEDHNILSLVLVQDCQFLILIYIAVVCKVSLIRM